jgi:putative component of toxin-antitoxin plasmid stabilization module
VGTKELRIYETKDGKAPFSDWLSKLKDVSARGVIRTRLNRVRLVILLVGGSKASQRKDIERAKDYWKDYRSRSNE